MLRWLFQLFRPDEPREHDDNSWMEEEKRKQLQETLDRLQRVREQLATLDQRKGDPH